VKTTTIEVTNNLIFFSNEINNGPFKNIQARWLNEKCVNGHCVYEGWIDEIIWCLKICELKKKCPVTKLLYFGKRYTPFFKLIL